jgi:hypothetical protein
MEFVECTDRDARRLLERLGSFWHGLFDGQAELLALFRARALAAEQHCRDWLEAYDCAVFADIPVFHREHWELLTLVESEILSAPPLYGEAGVDFGGGYRYGRAAGLRFRVPLPAGRRSLAFLHDDPLHPKVSYARGVDFKVEDGFLVFPFNPFEDDRQAPAALRREDGGSDRALALWAEHLDRDRGHLLSHLGAALKLHLPSSESARRALAALAALYAAFPSRAALTAFLAALADAPAVLEERETVEAVLERPAPRVVTDRHVYETAAGAAVLVRPGDVLRRGDPLTDAVRFLELAHELPDRELLPALAAGPALLAGDYRGELVFPNESLPATREGGKVRFPVRGDPADAAAFWERVDAGGGLALEGNRVNPALALLSCLRGHGVFIRLNARSFGPLASPRLILEFARRALAPRLVVLSYVELAAPAEPHRLVEVDGPVEIIEFIAVEDEIRLLSRDGSASAQLDSC